MLLHQRAAHAPDLGARDRKTALDHARRVGADEAPELRLANPPLGFLAPFPRTAGVFESALRPFQAGRDGVFGSLTFGWAWPQCFVDETRLSLPGMSKLKPEMQPSSITCPEAGMCHEVWSLAMALNMFSVRAASRCSSSGTIFRTAWGARRKAPRPHLNVEPALVPAGEGGALKVDDGTIVLAQAACLCEPTCVVKRSAQPRCFRPQAFQTVKQRNEVSRSEVDACITERGVDDCLDGPSVNVAAWPGWSRRREKKSDTVVFCTPRSELSPVKLVLGTIIESQVVAQLLLETRRIAFRGRPTKKKSTLVP